ATVSIPSSRQVRIIRTAISPLFAISNFRIFVVFIRDQRGSSTVKPLLCTGWKRALYELAKCYQRTEPCERISCSYLVIVATTWHFLPFDHQVVSRYVAGC